MYYVWKICTYMHIPITLDNLCLDRNTHAEGIRWVESNDRQLIGKWALLMLLIILANKFFFKMGSLEHS